MNIKLIDNFLNNADLVDLQALDLKKIKDNEIKVYHNAINTELKILSNEVLSEKFITKLHENYHNKAINILNELCPEKVKLYE